MKSKTTSLLTADSRDPLSWERRPDGSGVQYLFSPESLAQWARFAPLRFKDGKAILTRERTRSLAQPPFHEILSM